MERHAIMTHEDESARRKYFAAAASMSRAGSRVISLITDRQAAKSKIKAAILRVGALHLQPPLLQLHTSRYIIGLRGS